MAAPRILPGVDAVLSMRRHHRAATCPVLDCTGQPHTYEQIGRAYGVRKQAVFMLLRDAGRTGSRPTYRETIPWRLAPEHMQTHVAMMLRVHARIQRGHGHLVPERKRRMYDAWLAEMEKHDRVVCYDPDHGPNEASRLGGFYYAPRLPGEEGIARAA